MAFKSGEVISRAVRHFGMSRAARYSICPGKDRWQLMMEFIRFGSTPEVLHRA
jgi:hypothetical protein